MRSEGRRGGSCLSTGERGKEGEEAVGAVAKVATKEGAIWETTRGGRGEVKNAGSSAPDQMEERKRRNWQRTEVEKPPLCFNRTSGVSNYPIYPTNNFSIGVLAHVGVERAASLSSPPTLAAG